MVCPRKRRFEEEERQSIPNVLQGEVARLDPKFLVNLDPSHCSNNGTVHLICKLGEWPGVGVGQCAIHAGGLLTAALPPLPFLRVAPPSPPVLQSPTLCIYLSFSTKVAVVLGNHWQHPICTRCFLPLEA